ncbi:MAG: hypothetical protein H6797_05335 [Candidatus Nomurabacteria bacterium]|nr:MAG: hypothetical protein H6797_05335 [Candidatus Nomurabacteria bacterium]
MKNTEVASIVLIASISVVVAYFVASMVIGQPSGESVKVKTIAPISDTIETPDKTIFNKDAINPTVEVEIGNGQTP